METDPAFVGVDVSKEVVPDLGFPSSNQQVSRPTGPSTAPFGASTTDADKRLHRPQNPCARQVRFGYAAPQCSNGKLGDGSKG